MLRWKAEERVFGDEEYVGVNLLALLSNISEPWFYWFFSAEIWIFFSSGCAGGASWSSNSSQSNEAAQLLTLLSEPLLHISQVQKPISTLHAHSYKKESKWWVKLVPVFIQTAGFSKGIISDLLAENQILCARIPVGLQPHSFICGGWLSIVGSVRVLAGIIQHAQRAD